MLLWNLVGEPTREQSFAAANKVAASAVGGGERIAAGGEREVNEVGREGDHHTREPRGNAWVSVMSLSDSRRTVVIACIFIAITRRSTPA